MKTIKVVNQVCLLGLLFAFLDQFSKVLVREYTDLPISFNKGVAFSIPVPGFTQIILSVVLLCCIVFFAKRIVDIENSKKKKNLSVLSLSMIFGGGLGNLMDRINLGQVVDFIDVGFWPIFNLADSFITIGAIMLAVLWLKK